MTRREFIAAAAAAGLVASKSPAATPFPVHYAKPNPYDAALRFIRPGTDEFKSEKEAVEWESRLYRIFAGKEPAPPALQSWTNRRAEILAARFYVLPGSRVRYEIKTATEYHTGLWSLPDFRALAEDTVTSPRPYFTDVTGHVFGAVPSFRDQLIPGNPYWRARLDSACGIDVFGNQGISVADIDNDGVDEIYVLQPAGLPNRLYRIREDGTAEDITERSGLGILDETTSALFADFRNSGNQDAVVLRASGPLYFVNQGDGRFIEKPNVFRFETNPAGSFTGMAAADYDRDGRLDLYLCCYVYFQSEDQYQYPAPYQDARNGPPNFLFRNRGVLPDGGILFEDVTAQSGMNDNNNRFSFAPAWCDFDNDGWPDLFVANDFGRGNLYRNHEGKFRDEAARLGLDGAGPGMSASWFDYNGDGRPDLYVSDMWTAPGQRVVTDPAFQPAKGHAEDFRRHTKGNSLYRNKGDGSFEETGAHEGVEMGRWAWSSGGFDWDLDGVPEILVATGMVTNRVGADPAEDLNGFFWRQVVAKSPPKQSPAPDYENGWNGLNQLIRGDYNWNGQEPNVFYVKRDGRYRDASGVSGLDFADDTRSFALIDFDRDGVPDLILRNRLGPQIRAMRNDSTANRPSIAIALQGVKSNRDAIGARVTVNGQTLFLAAGSGFLTQHSKKLYFGLAGKPTATAEITWPSGATQRIADLAPGHCYTIVEGSAAAKAAAFRPRTQRAASSVAGQNNPEFGDSWLLEPVPTPDRRTPKGENAFLVIHAGEPPKIPGGIPVEYLDVRQEKDDVAAVYSLFRRYLFEYRVDLALPLVLLIDGESRARKVYASPPSPAQMRGDLARIAENHTLALPFPGRYYLRPHRSYFKLGAAFYWAGYPDRALPYLAETLRGEPMNWKALNAMARIQFELGRDKDALTSFLQVIDIRNDYPPAFVGAGEVYAKQNDRPNAQRMFHRAIDLDPKCADAMNQLGLLSAQANDLTDARSWFQKAIEAQQDHPGAINNLAVLYAKIGQPADAIAAFRYGIKTNPDDDELYLNLARIYVTMGEREKARMALNELMERKPGNPTATHALAQLESQ